MKVKMIQALRNKLRNMDAENFQISRKTKKGEKLRIVL